MQRPSWGSACRWHFADGQEDCTREEPGGGGLAHRQPVWGLGRDRHRAWPTPTKQTRSVPGCSYTMRLRKLWPATSLPPWVTATPFICSHSKPWARVSSAQTAGTVSSPTAGLAEHSFCPHGEMFHCKDPHKQHRGVIEAPAGMGLPESQLSPEDHWRCSAARPSRANPHSEFWQK